MKFFIVLMLTITVIANCDEYKKMKLKDVVVEYFNTAVFNESTFDISVNYNADGKTTLNVLIDVIQDLTEDIFVKLKVYGQALGTYKVPTGISFDMNVCQGFTEYFFKPVFEKLSSLDNCPWKKGRYQLEDYNIDAVGLPMPAHPGFRVLLDSEMYSKTMTYLKVKAYLKLISIGKR